MDRALHGNDLNAIFHSLQGEQLPTNIWESLSGLRFCQSFEAPFLRFFMLRTRRLVLCSAVLYSAYITLALISELLLDPEASTPTLFATILIGLSSLLLTGIILRPAYGNVTHTWLYKLVTPITSVMPIAFSLMLFVRTAPSSSQTMTATLGLFYATFLIALLLRLRLHTSLPLFIMSALGVLLAFWGTWSMLLEAIDLHAITAIVFGMLMCAVLEYDARCDFVSRAQIYHLATTDLLSKSLNRHAFFERGQMEIDRVRRYNGALTLLMVDIDHFKQVNDHYGHLVGDQVIAFVGDTSRSSLRSTDLLGRIGGEEFAFLLTDTHLDAALIVAERLRQSMQHEIITPAGIVRISISIGLVQYCPGEKLLQELIERADRCLYMAKRSGRNRIIAADPAPANPHTPDPIPTEPLVERAVGTSTAILTS